MKSVDLSQKNILYNAVGGLFYYFIQWLLAFICVYILGYKEVGIFSLCMSIGNSFSILALFSIRTYQNADISHKFSNNAYIFTRFITSFISIICCGVFLLFSGFDSYVFSCILTYFLFKVAEAISDVFQGVLQVNNRLDIVGFSFILRGIISFVSFGALILITHDLLIAILAFSVSNLIFVFTFDFYFSVKCKLKIEPKLVKSIINLLVICFPIAIFGFSFIFATQLPRMYIESIMGAEQLGYYTTIAMPVIVIQVSCGFLFAPLVTPLAKLRMLGKNKEFNLLIIKVVLFILFISVVFFVLFFFFGDLVYGLLFGEEIFEYTYLMYPLLFCTILTALAWFISSLLVVVEKNIALAVIAIISFVVSAVFSPLFINMFGLNGANFALIFSLLFFVLPGIIVFIVNRNIR